MNLSCRCRCHGDRVEEFCCPECEPEAYDSCSDCGALRYEHAEGARDPVACAAFVERGEGAVPS